MSKQSDEKQSFAIAWRSCRRLSFLEIHFQEFSQMDMSDSRIILQGAGNIFHSDYVFRVIILDSLKITDLAGRYKEIGRKFRLYTERFVGFSKSFRV